MEDGGRYMTKGNEGEGMATRGCYKFEVVSLSTLCFNVIVSLESKLLIAYLLE
jgi:hypothetical protein